MGMEDMADSLPLGSVPKQKQLGRLKRDAEHAGIKCVFGMEVISNHLITVLSFLQKFQC